MGAMRGLVALHLLALPIVCFGGQAYVALHRKSNQLDSVASRSAKNVAVSSLLGSSCLPCSLYLSNLLIKAGQRSIAKSKAQLPQCAHVSAQRASDPDMRWLDAQYKSLRRTLTEESDWSQVLRHAYCKPPHKDRICY